MAKTLQKKEFDVDALTQAESSSTQYKPQEYLNCGAAFERVTGLPGPALGHLNMFLGHTDSGKTAAMIKAIMNSQKRGRLPVIIITEEKWSFEHAQLMGVDCKLMEDGNWRGRFIFRDDFDYVEQITDYINALIDRQNKGEIPFGMDFFWDSVGSVPCKMTWDGKGGKQHTAGVLSDKIGMGLNRRITSTRKAEKPYTNSMTILVQPWVFIDMNNVMSKPKLQGKGGNAVPLNSTLIFQFGNIQNSGISSVSAVKQGRKIKFATRTKISVKKNHINGLGYEDGTIIITPHDFILDDKKTIDEYKKQYNDYWQVILGVTGDFDLIDEGESSEARIAQDIGHIVDKDEDDSSGN
jgi:hypothetical protein